MIEFSCQSWAFNDLTLQEALGTIARLGFRYADIGSGPHLNAVKAAADPRRVAAEIVGDLRVYNLKLADVYLMLPRISAPEPEVRAREVEVFKAMVPFIVQIGAPGVTLSPGLAQPPKPIPDDLEGDARAEAEAEAAAEVEAVYVRAREALAEMVAAAEGEFAVSIEPHLDSLAADLGVALRLVEEVDGLKITLDWAHPVCQNVRHEDIVRLLPHARHVQMRQAARGQLQTPFRRGRIKVEEVMEALKAADYAGVVGVEYMKTPGWHGMIEVNTLVEAVAMRDALRDARDNIPPRA
jgi:sugar phosphate isomerase/epimerase